MQSRKYSIRIAAMAVCVLASLTATSDTVQAQAKAGDIVAVVNGVELTEGSLALAAAAFGNQLQQIPAPQRRAALIGVIVDMAVLADAAKTENLDQSEEYLQRIEFMKIRALHDEYLAKKIGASVTDEQVKAQYDADVKTIPSPVETRARHILVKTEEEGVAIIAELDNGADFVELAKTKSTGPSGPNGGDLDYFTRDRMVKPFADAAFSMEPSSYSKKPVQSQFGWHIIKVEDRREKPKPTFEEMAGQIRSNLVREQFVKTIAELKAKATIEIPEKK